MTLNKETERFTRDFVLRLFANSLSIAFTAWLLPGITVANNDIGTYLIIAFVFGIVNALVKPIMMILSCGCIVFTFGAFLLVINGAMLWITAGLLSDRLMIDNFWWAILGGLIMAILGSILETQFGLGNDDDHQPPSVIVMKK